MTHYPNHLRQAFCEWIEAGFPDTATIEIDYEPIEITARDLLRRFYSCSDILPRRECAEVADYVGLDESAQGLTYGAAAGALVVERTTNGGGADFIERLAEAR